MKSLTSAVFLCATVVSISASSGGEIFGKPIFPPLPAGVSHSENVLCEEQSREYARELENFTLWAYEMWDSTAKSSSGVLRGSVYQMGHFEQCMTAPAPFPTKYCLVAWTANIPKPKDDRDFISLYHDPNELLVDRLYPTGDLSQQNRNEVQVGWCIPGSCSPQDLEKYLNDYVKNVDLPLKHNNVTFTAKLSGLACHTATEKRILDAPDIIFCLVSAVLIFLVILGTMYEVNKHREMDEKPPKKTLPTRLILAFSARKNLKSLPKVDESDPALTVLYGTKVICIFMIIMDHRYATFISSALLNFDFVEREYRSLFASFFFHGDLFVDTFFLMGGLLVTYGLLNQFEKKKTNPIFLILMRYVRLTPAYAFVIFYYATVFAHVGDGPLWKIVGGQDSKDCRTNWWTNLLYISNYVNVEHMCMSHSWYLPCDFHFFLVGIVVCMLITKRKKLGLSALLILTIISALIPFALTMVYERSGLMHFYPEFLRGPKEYIDFKLIYSKSHARATPYFVGMFAGFIYYKLKGTNNHISRVKSYIILLISVILILASFIGGLVFYDPYHKHNSLESATYAALHRPAFALGSIGLLYVASYGHASFLYKILSWWPWIPLSKLVYGAYLIHMQFALRGAATFMNPRSFTYFDVFCLVLSDIVLAFLSGLALYLAIEAPFKTIFKDLLMPPPASSSKDPFTRKNNELVDKENVITDSRL